MTLEERLDELVARFAKLEAETTEEQAKRLARNDAAKAARENPPVFYDARANELRAAVRELKPLTEWESWLATQEAAQLAELRALGTTEPAYAGDALAWKRKREDISDTLEQIRYGVGQMEPGRLRELAARDGLQPLPGCERVFERRRGLAARRFGATAHPAPSAPRPIEPPDRTALRAALEQRVAEWRETLRRNPRQGRLVLETLMGPLEVSTPMPEEQAAWIEKNDPEWSGEAKPEALLARTAAVRLGTSPAGFEPALPA